MNFKKNKIISNIRYALKNIWIWDRKFFLFFVPLIPISVCISLLEIYFPKIIIDMVEENFKFKILITTICVYFLIVLLLSILRLFCNSKLSARKYNISHMYQNMIYQKYMTTDFYNTEDVSINIKFKNAINDASSGQCSAEFIWQSLFDLLKSMLGIISYGAIISLISPWVLIFLVISALLTYVAGRLQNKFFEKTKDKRAQIDRKISYLTDICSNFEYAKDIRIYNMKSWLVQKFASFQKDQFRWKKKLSFVSLLGTCFNSTLTLIRDLLSYVFLIFMLIDNKISIGDFVFLFGAITGFSTWIDGISKKFNEIVERGIKIGYYIDYFGTKEQYNHSKGCVLPDIKWNPIEIEFKNVSYKYSMESNEYVLKNVSFKVRAGEKIAIVGINGAGKTTLIKLLCGFYYPSEGNIEINGKNIKEYNIEEYYTLFSAVFQDFYLLPIKLKNFVSSKVESDDNKVIETLSQCGLYSKIKTLPNGINSNLMKGVFDDSIDLSGGEKQKLMLARALYKDAPIFILDEPTSALDPIAENQIYLQYNNLTMGKTSFYISHRLASTKFCDRIFFIENGEIIEEGTHDNLLKHGGKYAHMYEIQKQYYMEDINET